MPLTSLPDRRDVAPGPGRCSVRDVRMRRCALASCDYRSCRLKRTRTGDSELRPLYLQAAADDLYYKEGHVID